MIARAYLPVRSEVNPFTAPKVNKVSVGLVKSCVHLAVDGRLAGLVTGEPERLFWYKTLADIGYNGQKVRLHCTDGKYEGVRLHLAHKSGPPRKTWDF